MKERSHFGKDKTQRNRLKLRGSRKPREGRDPDPSRREILFHLFTLSRLPGSYCHILEKGPRTETDRIVMN